MKKLISLILALVLICSLIPMTAFAAFNRADYIYIHQKEDGTWIGGKLEDENSVPKEFDITKEYLEYLKAQADKNDDDDGEVYLPHSAEDKIVGYGCDTKYHWWQCSCGCKIGMERHVDPKNTTDDTCVCGYHFSDDADLVTLWLDGCLGLEDFRKDVYEYETKAYTYKDVQKIKRIATRTHDSQATVELPEDLTLKEGENKFEIKVTAENQKVTKVYTVIVNKEPKK